MKNLRNSLQLSIFFALFLGTFLSVSGQDVKFAGTKPPDPAVLELLGKYEAASKTVGTVAERDAKRKPLLSTGYFYHGLDGKAIDVDGLTARQTKNEFRQIDNKMYNFVLYQFENTAMLTFQTWNKVMDMGKEREGYGSHVIVMGKENGVWKILSDILGREPEAPEASKTTSPKKQ